jgi:hypothetical protein
MKMNAGWARDWISRGSIVMLAGFAIFVLAENGCSGSSSSASYGDAGGTPISGCFAGETLTQVGKGTLCCSGTAPNLVCHDEGGRVGDPCSASSFPASAQTVTVTLDVCISDTDCTGDKTPTTYDAKTVAVTTPLTCNNGSLVANGPTTSQEVDRVCTQTAVLTCGAGYGYGYGYGYYGASNAVTRSVSVASSTCTTSNNAPSPCDVGEL